MVGLLWWHGIQSLPAQGITASAHCDLGHLMASEKVVAVMVTEILVTQVHQQCVQSQY